MGFIVTLLYTHKIKIQAKKAVKLFLKLFDIQNLILLPHLLIYNCQNIIFFVTKHIGDSAF